ncbi:MAG: ABC transporter substrate-binding protein [Propionicimonas sp.]|nr:ABC transporter substrate-binding protein [Propionicimonas sp.]
MSLRTAALAVAASALVLAGCAAGPAASTGPGASAPAASAATASDTFTYAIAGDPTSLNPINTGDRWGLTVTNIVYSPLARVEADGTVVNELAESIEPAADGLSVTVKLKEGITWSDGEPLTADDVVFTYTNKAVKENGNADLLWIGDKPIKAVKVDDLTVRFELPSFSAAALSNIATETYIIPEHVYGDVTDFSGAELDPIAVGTGPYRLTEYKRGEYLAFEANESFYGGAPAIKHLTLRIVSNADTVKAALQTGEVDASFVTPAQIADLANSPIDIHAYPEGRVAYLGTVAASPELSDVRVRQAVFYALNRDDLNKAAYLSQDYFADAYSILPPSNPFATTEVESYPQDVDKSKQLLGEAGVSGLTLTLGYAGSDPAQTLQATLIQQQLAAAGITVELAGVEPAAVYAEIEKGADSAYDLFIGGYIMGIEPDAYSLLFRTGASSNYFSYSNPATDALFDQGIAARDEAERKTIYADLQRQIADDAVFYPIADNLKILAVNQRIGGVDAARTAPIYTLENFGLLTEK